MKNMIIEMTRGKDGTFIPCEIKDDKFLKKKERNKKTGSIKVPEIKMQNTLEQIFDGIAIGSKIINQFARIANGR